MNKFQKQQFEFFDRESTLLIPVILSVI